MPLFANRFDVHPTKALYLAAADLIERNGLNIGNYTNAPMWKDSNEGSCFCTVGALLFSALGADPHAFTLESTLSAPFGGTHQAILFNDTHTQDEVVQKLRDLAQTLGD